MKNFFTEEDLSKDKESCELLAVGYELYSGSADDL